MGDPEPRRSTPGNHLQRPNLKTLDLRALPREDGPPSETQLRRQKYQFFEKQCSEIADGLFLSGDWVAKNREVLQQNGITHVVNCVGFICKEYFKAELDYRTYFLQDTPAEDVLCVLYDAFEYIDNAINSGGRVLVHCSQGVSRSATIVIAYLMWKTGGTYDDVFARVKAIRGVANPNIGFTCQLLQWQKRRHAPPTRTRMYRIAPHCAHAPLLLVPKIVTPPKKYATHTWRELDPRGAFIVQTPAQLYVWVGAQCPPPYAAAAEYAARLLPKFEAAGSREVVICEQGREPEELCSMLDPPALDPESERQNARRASITGDLFGPTSSSSTGPSALNTADAMDAEGPGLGMPGAASSDLMMLDTLSGTGAGAPEPPAVPFPLPRTPSLELAAAAAAAVAGTDSSSARPPVLLLSPPGAAAPMLRQSSSIKARPSPTGPPPWCAREVEEYSSEYQLYWDALRGGGGSNGGPGAGELGLGGVRGSSDRVRELRLGLMGAMGMGAGGELDMGMGVGVGAGTFLLGGLSSTGGMMEDAGMGGMGGLLQPLGGMGMGMGGMPLGSMGMGDNGPYRKMASTTALTVTPMPPGGGMDGPSSMPGGVAGLQGLLPPQRPESPVGSGPEGRLKKYRRGGGDAELAAMLATDPAKRMFPSLHHSIDEEEMP